MIVVIEFALSICSLVTSISAVVAVFVTLGKRAARAAKAPNEAVNKRVDELQRITSKALLALLDHAINGNNDEGLKSARDELHTYLIE